MNLLRYEYRVTDGAPAAEPRDRVRSFATRAALVALVALVAFKSAYGELGTSEIGFDDEAGALEHGIRFTRPTAEWAPLYSLWYGLLSLVIRDPQKLYYGSWLVLTVALPLMLYALARRLGAPSVCAALVASLWSIGHCLHTWPFVSLFATVLIAGGAIGVTYVKTWSRALAITALTLTVASFARPELAAPSFVVAGAAAVVIGRSSRSRPREKRALALDGALTLLPLLVLRVIYGDPMKGGRGFFAFGQHYALNRIEADGLLVDKWTDWDTIARKVFPNAQTVLEAARENPAAFKWHVLHNLGLVPAKLKYFVSPCEYVPREFGRPLMCLVAIVLLAGVAAVRHPRRRLAWEKLRTLWPLGLVIVGTTVAAVVVVQPRQHYFVTGTFLVYAALAGASRVWLDEALLARWDARAAAVVLGLVLVITPTYRPGALPSLAAAVPPPAQQIFEGRETIATLRSLQLREPIVILESSYSRAIYAQLAYRRVAQWEKYQPFWTFVHERGVDVIVLDKRLREDTRFRADPEFTAFLNGTTREDFRFIPVPGVPVDLAIRAHLLP